MGARAHFEALIGAGWSGGETASVPPVLGSALPAPWVGGLIEALGTEAEPSEMEEPRGDIRGGDGAIETLRAIKKEERGRAREEDGRWEGKKNSNEKGRKGNTNEKRIPRREV